MPSTPRLLVTVLNRVPGRVTFVMRTIVFIDGQNLYHLAKNAWESHPPRRQSRYAWPSYDVEKLASALVAKSPNRTLAQIRFYTGVPSRKTNRFWHDFWSNKLRYLRSRGIAVYSGSIGIGGQEKGVDVSLAIDLVQATYERKFECAIIVSQDKDFQPAVLLSKAIAQAQGRKLVFESSFPFKAGRVSRRGVPETTWVPINKSTYDACFDPTDYRPKYR